MKKLLTSLLSTVLALTICVPVFASSDSSGLDYEQFKTSLLEATLQGNDELASNILENNPELNEQYVQSADAFDSDKVNEKLKNVKLGANDSVLIVMDDNSFVKVTTVTKPVKENNTGISTRDYQTDYDMSGTKWSTTYTYESGSNFKLVMNTYYQIGSKMNIYQYDYSGTDGSLGFTVDSVNQSVSGNNTATATVKGNFTVKIVGGNKQYYTLYTEIGFLKAYLESDGYYYVDYYINSWKS
ncbi:hypothetical protein [Paenibacillus caui]|uniref:hypothetical protein n=1 Tax=Paenibacillus caui TaxID=2873927 RepID=UPI001CA9A45C|nr:hypothetical protein [Paenibacillus caui]